MTSQIFCTRDRYFAYCRARFDEFQSSHYDSEIYARVITTQPETHEQAPTTSVSESSENTGERKTSTPVKTPVKSKISIITGTDNESSEQQPQERK